MCFKELYEKLWWGEDVGNEMLTPQFRRMMNSHPVAFWGIVSAVAIPLISGASGMIWFILHIVGVC
jgi:hypothetical protein